MLPPFSPVLNARYDLKATRVRTFINKGGIKLIKLLQKPQREFSNLPEVVELFFFFQKSSRLRVKKSKQSMLRKSTQFSFTDY